MGRPKDGYGKYGYFDFSRFWCYLAAHGKNKQWLRNHGVHASVISRMAKNEGISFEALSFICYLLDCQVYDVMEYRNPEKEQIHDENIKNLLKRNI